MSRSIEPLLTVLRALLACVAFDTRGLWAPLPRLRASRTWRLAFASEIGAVTEAPHPGTFLLSEANGLLSRDKITVLSGQNLKAGTVLGKVTASSKYKILNPAGADGSEVAAGLLWGAVDASAADAPGTIINRDAEVKGADLVYPAGITAAQKTTAIGQLLNLDIKVR